MELEKLRKESDLPTVTEKLGWRYHHLGIPVNHPIPGERYIPHLKMHVSGFESSPFGIEWMRFDDDAPIAEIIKTVPHIAFEVDDLDAVLRTNQFEILSEPADPSSGVRVAMIIHNGAPIELMEFDR